MIKSVQFLIVVFITCSLGSNLRSQSQKEPEYSKKISACRTTYGRHLDSDCLNKQVYGHSIGDIEFIDENGKSIDLNSIKRPKYIQTFSRYVANAQ